MPFYKHLSEAQLSTAVTRTSIVAVLPDTDQDARLYLGGHGLYLPFVAGVDFKALNLTGAPTLILVDKSGKILNFWIGKPPPQVQQQIAEAVGITDQ